MQSETVPQQRRRVGLIGGMSWRSTALYYERLNRATETKFGAHHSFQGLVWNLDYARLLAMASAGDWAGLEQEVVTAARGLTRAGCQVVALTAVTAHLCYDAVCANETCRVPHVLAATARELDSLDARTIGVLGTGLTCGADFLRERLGGGNRDVLVLPPDGQAKIDALIQTILTAADDREAGRALLREAADDLRARGAEIIVLACTELPLLLPAPGIALPLIDSVALHVDDICDCITRDNHAA